MLSSTSKAQHRFADRNDIRYYRTSAFRSVKVSEGDGRSIGFRRLRNPALPFTMIVLVCHVVDPLWNFPYGRRYVSFYSFF